MKPVSKYLFPFALPQRAVQLTAICVVTTALAACGGGSGGGTLDGGSDTDTGATIDSDDDGLSDQEEASLGTDPLLSDSDADGLSDIDEVDIHFTDPLERDTDADGIWDNEEIDYGLNPNDSSDAEGDLDNDGVDNLQEVVDGTDPTDPASFIDTDGNSTSGASECVDSNSSNSDWGDNCQIQRAGTYADSLYTVGIQRVLWCQGFGNGLTFDVYTDGEFGPGTQGSVEAFQEANSLAVDGIVGPNTWAALRNRVSVIAQEDVRIDGIDYTSHTVDGCDFDGAQFYQDVTFGELGGWKMAETPGSTTLIDFSTGSPF